MTTAAAPPYPITGIGDDEYPAFVRAISRAFGESPGDDTVAHFVELEAKGTPLVARDGDRIVGTTSARNFQMSVPGAPPVACAGVTAVSVQPTHRRRGVMTSLMRRQIDDLRAEGRVWAALYASEAAIYGRYGYGVATRSRKYRIDGPWTRFVDHVPPATVELLDIGEALDRVPAIYQAAHDAVPGMMAVPDDEWRWHLRWDPESERHGASQRQIAVIADRAYATYRVKSQWNDAGPDGELRVEDCVAIDALAHRQLWAFLLGIDLIGRVTARMVPVDDPLPWWLAERQRLRICDGMPMYVRLIDVGAALSQRGTTTGDAVVLDVHDGFCPWNSRRWRLEGDGGVLHCAATDATPDIALDVRELASLSLGGVAPAELARAGLIDEQRADALRRLDALLTSDRPPWNVFVF